MEIQAGRGALRQHQRMPLSCECQKTGMFDARCSVACISDIVLCRVVLCLRAAGAIVKEFRNGVVEGGLSPEATLSYDGQFLMSGGFLPRGGWLGWACVRA